MFCGSCMHDNTWARALAAAGEEVTLLPTYTPIRVDEPDVSTRQVFLGGINVYLDQRSRLWRKLPRALTHWLDQPWVINLATRFAVSNNARRLGELTIAMLEGEHGPERQPIEELADFLGRQLRPDVVVYSNALLAGTLRLLKERYRGRVYATLQGDDVFLDALNEPYRTRAMQMLRERVRDFDGFLVHSRYYRDYMAEYLDVPVEKFHRLPLGIDFAGHDGQPKPRQQPFTFGYFARICPEKGLKPLAEAFRLVHARHPRTRLLAGGYLSPEHRPYLQEVERLAEPVGSAFQYIGSPATHEDKVAFLRSLDVLSVPTVYHEPKGLYVLEAWANGVPVVQPRHGAFPEMIDATRGGLLVESGSIEDLARGLEQLLFDEEQRQTFARNGFTRVRQEYSLDAMTAATLDVFRTNPAVADAQRPESRIA